MERLNGFSGTRQCQGSHISTLPTQSGGDSILKFPSLHLTTIASLNSAPTSFASIISFSRERSTSRLSAAIKAMRSPLVGATLPLPNGLGAVIQRDRL